MSDAQIRPTIPDDLDALTDVLVQVHAVDGYPVEGVDEPRAWVELPDPLGQWTAFLDDRPVGHVALLSPKSGDCAPGVLAENIDIDLSQVAVVARLFVSPKARGRSLANELMAVAEATARQANLYCVLDVMVKDVAAIAIYKSRGWRVLGKFEHPTDGAPEPALAMALTSEPF